MIKLAVFDIGGVLTHDDTLFLASVDSFLSLKEGEDILSLPGFRPLYNSYECGEISESTLWKRFSKESGIRVPEYGRTLLGKFFFPTFTPSSVKAVMSYRERGIRVAAGTNVLPSHYDYLEGNHMYDIFDAVYASFLMRRRKPNPEFFSYILEREGVRAEETLFFDDRQDNVDAALSLGIKAHRYREERDLYQL